MGNNVINYGQHFLTNRNVVNKLMEILNITRNNSVIEIGPGEGIITEELCKRAKEVTCYEIDTSLKPKLDVLEKKYSNLNVIYCNFLDVEIKECDLIVSSLPYQILEPFIKKLSKIKFNNAVITTGNTYAHSLFYEEFSSNHIKFTNLFTKCFFFVNVYNDIDSNSFDIVPNTLSSIVELKRKDKITLLSSQELYLMREIIEQSDKKIKNALMEGLIRFYDLRSTKICKNKAREIIERLNISNDILEDHIYTLSNEKILELYLILKNNSIHI